MTLSNLREIFNDNEASRGLCATAELLVSYKESFFTLLHYLLCVCDKNSEPVEVVTSPGSVLRFAVVDKTQHRDFV